MARNIGGTWRSRNEWSHKSYTRVELWKANSAVGLYWNTEGFMVGNAQKVRDLDVVDGTVTWDLANFVSSSMSLTVTTGVSGRSDVTDALPNRPDPDNPGSFLPAQPSYYEIPIETSWLVVYAGIEYAEDPVGSEASKSEERLGVYRVTGITPALIAGQTEITAEDGLTHMNDAVIDAEEIYNAIYNGTIANGLPWMATANAVILKGWNSRQVFAEDFHAAVNHTMVLAKDTNLLNQPRATLLQEWATAADGRFYMNSDGRICVRPLDMVWSDINLGITTFLGTFGVYEFNAERDKPYTSPYQDDSEMTAIIEITQEFTRGEMYNAVIVEWENPNASDATNTDYRFNGYSEDSNPQSPTYAKGPFGRRVLMVQDVPVHSDDEADKVAQRHLAHAMARSQIVTMKIPAYPAPEIGDYCFIEAPGIEGFGQLGGGFADAGWFVQSVEYPLGPDSQMILGLKRRS